MFIKPRLKLISRLAGVAWLLTAIMYGGWCWAQVKPSMPPPLPSVPSNPNPWLAGKLYGSDNKIARPTSVFIKPDGAGFTATVKNQFNFQCGISFDSSNNPEYLSNCRSLNGAQPKCNPDMSDSFCAKSSGCFLTKPETNPKCFETWEVKEPKIRLKCSMLPTEQVCQGEYTLVNGNYSDKARFTIARHL